jgi:hypothetical protein
MTTSRKSDRFDITSWDIGGIIEYPERKDGASISYRSVPVAIKDLSSDGIGVRLEISEDVPSGEVSMLKDITQIAARSNIPIRFRLTGKPWAMPIIIRKFSERTRICSAEVTEGDYAELQKATAENIIETLAIDISSAPQTEIVHYGQVADIKFLHHDIQKLIATGQVRAALEKAIRERHYLEFPPEVKLTDVLVSFIRKVRRFETRSFEEVNSDVELSVASYLEYLWQRAPERPLADVLPEAAVKSFEEEIIPGDEYKSFEATLLRLYDRLQNPPAKPLKREKEIASAFGKFTAARFFMAGLGEGVTSTMIKEQDRQDRHKIVAFYDGNRKNEATVKAWIQGEINAYDNSASTHGWIERRFKEAMEKLAEEMSPPVITEKLAAAICDGHLPDEHAHITDEFYGFIWEKIKEKVIGHFKEFVKFNNNPAPEDTVVNPRRAARILGMTPEEKFKNHVWPSLLQSLSDDVCKNFARVARELMKHFRNTHPDALLKQVQLMKAVVLTQAGFEKAVKEAVPQKPAAIGEALKRHFDEVNVSQMYYPPDRKKDRRERKTMLRRYIDILPHDAHADILEKVIDNPAWSRVFVFSSGVKDMEKDFGKSSVRLMNAIYKNLLDDEGVEDSPAG